MKWCLSAVRTFGGHDYSPRLPRSVARMTLPLPTSRSIRTDAPVISSYAQSHSTDPRNAFPVSSSSLEGRAPCGVARSRTSHFPIDALRRCLSPENVASVYPLLYSPTTIRSLYYRAESRNQLWMLDSKMLSLLIGSFGSFSVNPSAAVPYRESLASRFLQKCAYRTHWAFVLKVGRYKLGRAMPLQDSDRYWLMRAELSIVQARPPLESLPDEAYSSILRARTHYHIIRRHSRRPEIHTHYLETLIAIRDPRLLDFAACDLSFLLRSHRMFHSQLQRLLYRLVIQHGKLLSARAQDAILAALWSRACPGTAGTSDSASRDGSFEVALHDCISEATGIARSVATTLFGSADRLHNDRSGILSGHLLSVFSPEHARSYRWSSLVLLSIYNSSRTLHFDETCWSSDYAIPQVISCWQVIFGLAAVEKISQESASPFSMQLTSTETVTQIVRSLHQRWSSIVRSSLVSGDLACAVAITFFKMAIVLADADLFYECQRLYNTVNNSGGPRSSVERNLTAQYIAAAMRVRSLLPDAVPTAVQDFSTDAYQQHQILTTSVQALARIDVPLAYALYTVMQGKGMELDSGATYALAISFAQSGAFRQAFIFLNKHRFSLEKRGVFVSAVARSLRENPQSSHPPSVFGAIINELAALYRFHVPPEHFRGHLEQLLVVLTRHGRGRQLFPVMFSIFKRSPNFFQSRFFVRYCNALIRHRQFSTAGKLLNVMTTIHPKTARSLRILTDRFILQTRAIYRLSKRGTALGCPPSFILPFRPRQHPLTGSSFELSLKELLGSGRVLTAKRIFDRAATILSSRQCTVLGNVLLHRVSRRPTSRNGRGVRKVLALLENLVKNHGFRPDRVTANIVIKVMISWRSAFDSPRLRELFDQLVRGGYPAANYSPLHPPFGTQHTPFSGSSDLSKLPSSVSFERHARPLFKMFIKAFYLCNDVEAARRVVGILKVEDYKNATARETRRRARTRGRVKAGQKD